MTVEEFAGGKTRRWTGWRLTGYILYCNFNRISDLTCEHFNCPEEAKALAEELADYPLSWAVAVTDPEGHDHWLGLHPEMLDFELRFPGGVPIGKQQHEAWSAESEQLRNRVGPTAWRDRWRVEPNYDAVLKPVKGAIRPNPASPFYAAPAGHRLWGVYREGDGGSWIESHERRSDAVEAAARLANGRPTYDQERSSRRDNLFLALFVLIFVATYFILSYIYS